MQSLKAQLEQKLRIDPNDAEAHWKMGCVLGYMGEWDHAFDELEWRMKGHRRCMVQRNSYIKPDWAGEKGKVLIYQDQGHGDLMMWIRYAQLMPSVVLEVEPELLRLMRFNNFDAFSAGDTPPKYDYVLPATSLPARFKHVYNPVGYFQAPKTGKFHKSGKKQIGIAWAGNPNHAEDRYRSSRADEFVKLQRDDRQLVSLMVSQSDKRFVDYSMRLTDFYDTAEVISECDVVVTVDTAVAHLAAGLGKKAHLALAYQHDWRWGREDTTPWYPTMKLWRQDKLGDWSGVLARISDEIG